MARPRIGYDIDNVVTQTQIFVLGIVNSHLGTNYTLDDCSHQRVEDSFNLSVEEVTPWFINPGSGFPLDLKPVGDAKEVINKYHGALDQYFITARGLSLIGDSLKWFDENSFLYSPERVFFMSNTPEKKASLAKDYRLELFVEDNLRNANAIAEKAGIPVLLADFGYRFNRNRSYYHDLVKMVTSWKKIDCEIEKRLHPFK